jgi:hypothetical protein
MREAVTKLRIEKEKPVINWMPFPRPGTHFENGRWLCTVATATTLRVEILDLEGGCWFRNVSEKLTDREQVVAIAWVPEPAGFVTPNDQHNRPASAGQG